MYGKSVSCLPVEFIGCKTDDDCCSGLGCVRNICKDLTTCGGGSKKCCECVMAIGEIDICRSMGSCP